MRQSLLHRLLLLLHLWFASNNTFVFFFKWRFQSIKIHFDLFFHFFLGFSNSSWWRWRKLSKWISFSVSNLSRCITNDLYNRCERGKMSSIFDGKRKKKSFFLANVNHRKCWSFIGTRNQSKTKNWRKKVCTDFSFRLFSLWRWKKAKTRACFELKMWKFVFVLTASRLTRIYIFSLLSTFLNASRF